MQPNSPTNNIIHEGEGKQKHFFKRILVTNQNFIQYLHYFHCHVTMDCLCTKVSKAVKSRSFSYFFFFFPPPFFPDFLPFFPFFFFFLLYGPSCFRTMVPRHQDCNWKQDVVQIRPFLFADNLNAGNSVQYCTFTLAVCPWKLLTPYA